MNPSQTSDILHNNHQLLDQIKPNERIEILDHLLKGHQEQPRYVLDLPLLLLANGKFVRFQAPNKAKDVYIVDKDYMKLFLSDSLTMAQFVSHELPVHVIQAFKSNEFKSK